MKLPVDHDKQTLVEYREAFLEQRQEIENLAISLERNPGDITPLEQLRRLFDELWLTSNKLKLAPISDNVDTLIQVLDFMAEQNFYAMAFSEYLLLLIDRLLCLVNEVESHSQIDMQKAQNIEVSLQRIAQTETRAAFCQRLPEAISCLAGHDRANVEEGEIDPFEESDSTCRSEIELFLPTVATNPVAQAHEYMAQRQHEAASGLDTLLEHVGDYGEEHTQFLHELTIALNIMAGEPIKQEELWLAVCLHDIGLGHLQELLSRGQRLTPEEMAKVEEHPRIGALMAEKIVASGEANQIILDHHERLDGRGYPHGSKKDQISEGGKLLALVDAFHTQMQRCRCRRYSTNVLRAASEINACGGSHYDPAWIRLFNQCLHHHWLPLKLNH